MSAKHTAGPMKCTGRVGYIGDDTIFECPTEFDVEAGISPFATTMQDAEQEANAARIVACVNACESMPDPAAEIAKLRADNERLKEVLELSIATIERISVNHGPFNSSQGTIDVARAALAAAKAEK
jgi:hypothetical protein